MLQNCASECVNNRTYRTLQETCDEGAPCSSGQGSEALIGSLHIQALPTNRQKTRTCCCTCSCYKILCCNMPSDKNFLRKRACVRPLCKEHCAGVGYQCHFGPCGPTSGTEIGLFWVIQAGFFHKSLWLYFRAYEATRHGEALFFMS